MRNFIGFTLLLAVLAAFGTAPAWAGKTTICHFPPGNPANFHTITVGDNAVNAHVSNHGDMVGSCLENCEAICDDGNACTIDVEPDPDQCICAAEPRPQVDCNDGNPCTADACDAVNGTCTNDPGPLEGEVCEDGDLGTISEICFQGSCDPPCPCITGAEILANGAVAQCGSNFPGFPNLTAIIWANGTVACAGANCAPGGPLTCGVQSPGGIVAISLTPQESANCQSLLSNYCANPNLTEPLTSGEESETPFIDG